jgi:hypothetical protein
LVDPDQYNITDNIINVVPLHLIKKLPVPKVLTAQLTFDDLPESVRIQKCKVINIIRDPRGIAASGYNFVMAKGRSPCRIMELHRELRRI